LNETKQESLSGDEEWSRRNTRDTSFASVASSDAGEPPSATDDMVTALSRSLSVESFDSCEPTPLEQALLEQCIHSGMPHRPKNESGASVARVAAETTAKNATDAILRDNTMNGSNTWSDDRLSNNMVRLKFKSLSF